MRGHRGRIAVRGGAFILARGFRKGTLRDAAYEHGCGGGGEGDGAGGRGGGGGVCGGGWQIRGRVRRRCRQGAGGGDTAGEGGGRGIRPGGGGEGQVQACVYGRDGESG